MVNNFASDNRDLYFKMFVRVRLILNSFWFKRDLKGVIVVVFVDEPFPIVIQLDQDDHHPIRNVKACERVCFEPTHTSASVWRGNSLFCASLLGQHGLWL